MLVCLSLCPRIVRVFSMSSMDVDLDQPAAVHVGVALDGADEAAHPLGRLGQLIGQVASQQRGGDPAQGRVPRPAPASMADPVQEGLIDSGARERLGQAPAILDARLLERRGDGLFGVGGLECGAGARARRPCAAPRPASSRARPPAERSTPDSTKTPIVEPSTSSASARSEEARRAAAAGLLSSWARPAAIVPSDSSRSRFCSIEVIRPTTGRTRASTRLMIERLATASSTKSSGTIAARRTSVPPARGHRAATR